MAVESVTGAGPCTCTLLSELSYAHTSGESVTIAPGVSAILPASTTANISGVQALGRIQRGAHRRRYHVSFYVTLSDRSVLEEGRVVKVLDQ